MDASIWPWQYQTENGADPQLLTAILFASAGILLVVLIEKVAEKMKAGKTE